MTAHTPTPWAVEMGCITATHRGLKFIIFTAGKSADPNILSDSEIADNMAYIVKAVNKHQGLLKNCIELQGQVEEALTMAESAIKQRDHAVNCRAELVEALGYMIRLAECYATAMMGQKEPIQEEWLEKIKIAKSILVEGYTL